MKKILAEMYHEIIAKRCVYCLKENIRAFIKYCKVRRLVLNGGMVDETGKYFYI